MEARLKLEASTVPVQRRWLHQLPVLQWAVFREPMLLLELGRWSLESEEGKMALEYVKAMWAGVPNTLALENDFSDLRDNEGRWGPPQSPL